LTPLRWLKKVKKRSVHDVPLFLDERLFEELRILVYRKGWDYKTDKEVYQLRDRALISILILTGLRISEALMLKRLQFRIYDNRIILVNVKTVKSGLIRRKITLPKEGKLAEFTGIVERWLRMVPKEEHYVFPSGCAYGPRWDTPLSRGRAFWIIKKQTGRFPHWFRSVCETIYGRLIFNNDAWKLKEFMGLKKLDSTSPYVRGSWEEDEHKIFEL